MKKRFPILLLLFVLLAGCEEMVDPVLETERAFTLYGYLDPGADRQAIRVFPIEGVLTETQIAPLDLAMVLTGASGVVATFRDTVVTYWDGSRGHVFQTSYRPSFDAHYTIRLTGEDGRTTSVALRTPEKASLQVGTPAGVRGNVRMPILFEGADQILSPRVVYIIEGERAPFLWTVPVQYGEDMVRSGRDWSAVVDLSRDLGVLYTITGLQPGRDPIYLKSMRVEAFVATEDWTPPTAGFDADLLVQPGVFSNVSNGFGFVGSGYLESVTTLPDEELLVLAGFSPRPK